MLDKEDLELISTEDLIDELDSRFDAFTIAASNPSKDGSEKIYLWLISGSIDECADNIRFAFTEAQLEMEKSNHDSDCES